MLIKLYRLMVVFVGLYLSASNYNWTEIDLSSDPQSLH